MGMWCSPYFALVRTITHKLPHLLFRHYSTTRNLNFPLSSRRALPKLWREKTRRDHEIGPPAGIARRKGDLHADQLRQRALAGPAIEPGRRLVAARPAVIGELQAGDILDDGGFVIRLEGPGADLVRAEQLPGERQVGVPSGALLGQRDDVWPAGAAVGGQRRDERHGVARSAECRE